MVTTISSLVNLKSFLRRCPKTTRSMVFRPTVVIRSFCLQWSARPRICLECVYGHRLWRWSRDTTGHADWPWSVSTGRLSNVITSHTTAAWPETLTSSATDQSYIRPTGNCWKRRKMAAGGTIGGGALPTLRTWAVSISEVHLVSAWWHHVRQRLN